MICHRTTSPTRPSNCFCKLIRKGTVVHTQRHVIADKNVIITRVFTKCWTKQRSKARLVNPDGLYTLNCRHRLEISESSSKERRGFGAVGITGGAGQDREHKGEHRGHKASAACNPLHHHGALSGPGFSTVPCCLPVRRSSQNPF
ncbi:hypothetical protein AMECASPLE_032110 [Ameca splendens]|uniref:Uncharacterized protein n=1 Tax=Ameca splendens TaxID=208324 RepID=A0ABV0ZS46_9TELE